MQKQELNFQRIEKAIHFISENHKGQPELEQIAAHLGLSPFHFQRLFQEWAGVSPKLFLQFLTAEYAKKILRESGASLLDTTEEVGLSSVSRLHDLFIKIEAMTPGEYKNGGYALTIKFSFENTTFGDVLIASTPKGICSLEFCDTKQAGLANLKMKFPKAAFVEERTDFHRAALSFFSSPIRGETPLTLHIKGTPFQIKIWEALLKLPFGSLASYDEIASSVGSPGGARAAGSAIAKNPVAYLIPCHRVIRKTGVINQYHWGKDRKKAIIGWEASHLPT